MNEVITEPTIGAGMILQRGRERIVITKGPDFDGDFQVEIYRASRRGIWNYSRRLYDYFDGVEPAVIRHWLQTGWVIHRAAGTGPIYRDIYRDRHLIKEVAHWRACHNHQVQMKRKLSKALQAIKEHYSIPGADIDLAMKIPPGKRLPDEWVKP